MDEPMKTRIPGGTGVVDELIGGYEKDIITTVYGPAGSGKTLLCMLATIQMVKDGKKVIYVDTEGGFSVDRLSQITSAREILDQVLFLRPTTFDAQKRAIERIKSVLTEKIGLIVVDTIAMLYRVEIGRRDDVQDPTRELGLQVSYLSEIARKKNIPILIANQVYADFENPLGVKMVGGDILKYGSKCLLELQKTNTAKRRIIVRKHRSISESKESFFEIVEKGIQKCEKSDVVQ